MHVPLVVELGYGATRDLAGGCSVQPWAGIQSAQATTLFNVEALPSQSNQQIVQTGWCRELAVL